MIALNCFNGLVCIGCLQIFNYLTLLNDWNGTKIYMLTSMGVMALVIIGPCMRTFLSVLHFVIFYIVFKARDEETLYWIWKDCHLAETFTLECGKSSRTTTFWEFSETSLKSPFLISRETNNDLQGKRLSLNQ